MAGFIQHNNSSRSGAKRRTFTPKTEINITPLVDVMLVLVVIFMVTAPMMSVGVPVDLPKTNAAQLNDQTEPLVISIDGKGELYLQESKMQLQALIAKLHAIAGNNLDMRIYVRGDKNLPYGKIMEVMGVISSSGFSKVSLIAQSAA